MSWVSEKNKITNRPIWLFEIDDKGTQAIFCPYEAGIYYITLRKITGPTFGVFWATDDTYNTAKKNVASMTVTESGTRVQFTRVLSLESLRITNRSFMYVYTTQTLYVHFNDFQPWYVFDSIEIGITSGFSQNGFHSGSAYYPPQIASISDIKQAADSLFDGIMIHEPITIKLINTDNERYTLDELVQGGLYGLVARIKLGFIQSNGVPLDYDDFATMYTGKIESIPVITEDEVDIVINDQRKFLSMSVPTRRLSTDDFPYLDDDDAGKAMPLAFGPIRNAPCICLNPGETAPSYYTFLLADTTDWNLQSGQTVTAYVDGVAKTVYNFSNTAGTFQLAAAAYDPDNNQTVTASFNGFVDGGGDLIENGLYVVRELLRVYAEMQFTADFFNTGQWISYENSTWDVSLLIDEATKLRDIIADIGKSELGLFKFQRDGLLTFQQTDYDQEPVRIIRQEEILNPVEARFEISDLLSSLEVKYFKDYGSDKYRYHVNKDYEDDVYTAYDIKEEKSIEVLLNDLASVEEFAEIITERFGYLNPTFEIELPIRHCDLLLQNIIAAELNRVSRRWFGLVKLEIQSASLLPDSNLYQLTIKYIADYTEPLYIQGAIFGDFVFNGRVFGTTGAA